MNLAILNSYELALHYFTYGYGKQKDSNPLGNRLTGWKKRKKKDKNTRRDSRN